VLSEIEIDWPEGSKIAVVGPTGSGKSTLINLLLRFWAPVEGRITLGGVDLANLRSEDLRSRIALVSQHTHLFTGTIRENLLVANPTASQSRLEQACRTAALHDFIASQPDGYETEVGETGLALSGGQARRLAIARALLKDAPILVLDEPTEGLDGPTASALMKTLHTLTVNRSTLLITHRPEGLEDMDEIVVLEQGRITARGDHWQLFHNLAAYRDLWSGLDETPIRRSETA
jgi:ATP-binding cassette subfamily C protein CydC